jgi:hypothetical protein
VTAPAVATWLVAGYAVFLVAAAWGFDIMAKRVSRRAQGWRTGRFVYHPDHDAWQCPTDQWLWPTSFDPSNRVMRYRAKPVVCNTCPVKSDCTSSDHGREISRQVDPWPFSDAGRFHRGIACVVVVLAVLLLMGQGLTAHSTADLLVLGTVVLIVTAASAPLFRHLWSTPAAGPEHVPHRTAHEDSVVSAVDKYATRWGMGKTGREGGIR